MTVSQITPSQQALYYKILAKEATSSYNYSSSILQNYGNYSDLSPYLSTSLYNNNSSNIFSLLMNMFSNYIMQILMMMLSQNLSTSISSQTSDSSNGTTASDTVQKEPRDVVKLTSDNLESDLRNRKGTSYVIVCDSGCGRCIKFSPVLEAVNNNLNTSATFYSLKYSDEKQLEQTLKKESGADVSKSAGFPIIIKCVDGIAKEFYSYADVKDIYTDEEKMTEWFKNKL